jgi:hypothetical protein
MLQGSRGVAAVVSALFLSLSVARAEAQCVGDCDGNGFVQPPELRDAVQIALLELPATACTAYSGSIEVDDLVDAVIHAIGGCPTPTPSPSPTITPTSTITPTPVNTNTPGGVSNAVAGGAAVVAKSLGGIPSLVTAIVTGLTKGTAADLDPGEGSAAGACPLGGSATRVCTTPGTGGAQLALSLSTCAVSVPDGSLTFNTFSAINLVSGAPASCPTGVFPGTNINATADVTGAVRNLADELQLNTRATLSAIVLPTIPFPLVSCVVTGAQLTVTGSLVSALPNGAGGAILELLQTGVTLAISSFNADCVPVQYTLTFNGPAKVSDTTAPTDKADVTFSSFVVRVNATGNPTTLEMDGGLNFGCANGAIVLDTVTPLASIPGSICPTGGLIQITTPEGPGAIEYQSDGSVQVDIDNDGTFDNTFPSCIDPMLQLCPQPQP